MCVYPYVHKRVRGSISVKMNLQVLLCAQLEEEDFDDVASTCRKRASYVDVINIL